MAHVLVPRREPLCDQRRVSGITRMGGCASLRLQATSQRTLLGCGSCGAWSPCERNELLRRRGRRRFTQASQLPAAAFAQIERICHAHDQRAAVVERDEPAYPVVVGVAETLIVLIDGG